MKRPCSEWAVLADENGMYLSQPYDRGDDAISPGDARKLAAQLIAVANELEPIAVKAVAPEYTLLPEIKSEATR